jgi:hypothetical protein
MRISIYPNPASESVRIESETESRMAVFDLFGRTILSQPKKKTWDWDLKDANGRTVADGVYLVRMGSAVQRLVISR